jgi:hypothetical protein
MNAITIEPSSLTDKKSIVDLVQHAIKFVSDNDKDGWLWMGVATNNISDDTSEVIPEDVIMRDIAFTHYAIQNNLERPRGGVYDIIRGLNGDRFVDYGALLVDHDKNRGAVGRRLGRLMVKGLHACFEFGTCSSEVGTFHMALRHVANGNRMSHGFLGIIEETTTGAKRFYTTRDDMNAWRSNIRKKLIENKLTNPVFSFSNVHSYEASVLTAGAVTPANPFTLWMASPAQIMNDAVMEEMAKSMETQTNDVA